MADDTTIFLRAENDIPILIAELKRFSEVSGLSLNTSKTKGLLLGRHIQTRNKIHGIDSSATAIKSLGVYFGTSKQECLQLNWYKLIEDIQHLLNSWKRRKLTVFGKIVVLKSLVMSKCNYFLQCMAVPDQILNKIESLLFKFLWNDKNDKIIRKQLMQKYEYGGLKMVDIKAQLKSFQINWVNRLINKENANWKSIPTLYFDKYGKDCLIFEMNIGELKNISEKKLPMFYRNILEAWIKSGGGSSSLPKSFITIRNQIIWGNQFIKI